MKIKLQPLLFVFGIWILLSQGILLRFAYITEYAYRNSCKDPERKIPSGRLIVSPADGMVLYVKAVKDGIIPEIIKRGVSVPIMEHLKISPSRPVKDGFLIGIYMNTYGVHVNRVPNNGKIMRQTIFNGPHLNMTEAETKIIAAQLVPGIVTARKLLNLSPYKIEKESDYILKSARETLEMEDERGSRIFITRIADYFVGKILTWVNEGQAVTRGERLGMITWGSQTDIFIEADDSLKIKAQAGEYVYGGESVLAEY